MSKSLADWLALPNDARFELIDGELIEKAPPSFEHGRAQGRVCLVIGGRFDRKPNGLYGPGGWWIGSEIDIAMAGRGYRPDLAGWRRDRVPAPIKERPVTVRPDWLCEIAATRTGRRTP
jgi:Uma2 family endonuclease